MQINMQMEISMNYQEELIKSMAQLDEENAVSYTHLDVYKRQVEMFCSSIFSYYINLPIFFS